MLTLMFIYHVGKSILILNYENRKNVILASKVAGTK